MLNNKVERIIHSLERGWNSQVLETKPPPLQWRRMNLPDDNLKRLILQGKLPAVTETKSLPTRTTIDDNIAETPSAYNSITATLGFRHHKGTDKNAELKVLKFILKRESLLNLLNENCHPKEPNDLILQNRQKTGILDLMTQIRNVTVELIESICYWRTTMLNADPEIPRPFIYEDNNYLLKITYDLNFLADVSYLVENLGVDSTNMLRNPLMLPEPLDTDKLSIPPIEWAKKDSNNDINNEQYPERLKLRKAEHIILQEIEFNRFGGPSTSTVWNTYSVNTSTSNQSNQQNNNRQQTSPLTRQSLSQGSLPLHLQNVVNRKKTLLEWYDVAKLQMHKLETAQSENLNIDMTSTKRLIIPNNKGENLKTKYSTSPPRYVEPLKLYELTSDKVDEDYGANIFQDPDVTHPHLNSPKHSRTKSRESKARKSKRLPNKNNSTPRISDQEAMEILIYDGMMKTHHPNLIITDTDIHVIGQIIKPCKSLSLAGAATMIVLTENGEIPQNISWDFFRGFAVETPLANNMNTLKPASIPQYKIRAMKPFLINLEQIHNEDLQNDPSLKQNDPAILNSSTKIVKWIMEVMNFALNPPNLSLLNAAISSSTFQSVLNRRAAAIAEKKKRNALAKVATPEDMKVIYEIDDNKLVENVYLHIQLLSLKKKPLVDQLQRYVIKVIDEKTYEFCEAPINQREMDQYSWEIRESFPDVDMKDIFQPTSANWWKKYMLNVIQVQYYNNEFNVRISKRLIKLQLLKIYEEKRQEIQQNNNGNQNCEKKETKPKKSDKIELKDPVDESKINEEEKSNWSFHTEQNPESELEIINNNNNNDNDNYSNNNDDNNNNNNDKIISNTENEIINDNKNEKQIEIVKKISDERPETDVDLEPTQTKENSEESLNELKDDNNSISEIKEKSIDMSQVQHDSTNNDTTLKQDKDDNSIKSVNGIEEDSNKKNENEDKSDPIIENSEKPLEESSIVNKEQENLSNNTETEQQLISETNPNDIDQSPKNIIEPSIITQPKDDISLATPRSLELPSELGFESDDQSFPSQLGLYEVGDKIFAVHQNLDEWFEGVITDISHKVIQNHEIILYDVRYADGEEEHGLTSKRIKRFTNSTNDQNITESTNQMRSTPPVEQDLHEGSQNSDDLYNIDDLRAELENEHESDEIQEPITTKNENNDDVMEKTATIENKISESNVEPTPLGNNNNDNKLQENENSTHDNDIYDILFDDESDLKSLKESQEKNDTNASLTGENNDNEYDDEFEDPESPVKPKRSVIEDSKEKETIDVPTIQDTITSENENSTYNEYGESDFDQDDSSNQQNPSIILSSEPEQKHQEMEETNKLHNNNITLPTQSIISVDDTKTALLSDGDNNSLGYQDEEFDVDDSESNKKQEQEQPVTQEQEEEEDNYDDDFGDE